MKKLTVLLIVLFATLMLIGCEDGSHEQNYADDGQRTVGNVDLLSAFRNYNVQSYRLNINNIDIDSWQFFPFIHQEQLYVLLREECDDTLNTYINLLTMDADGTNIQVVFRSMLDENVDFFRILGFEKHDDGHITLVTTDNDILPPHTRNDYFDGLWDFEIEYSYICRRISPTGEVVSEFGIDALNNEERQIRISDIAFDLNGNAVASVSWLPVGVNPSVGQGIAPDGIEGQSFFLFNRGLSGDFLELGNNTYSNGVFNLTNDGQIIMPTHAWLQETDLIIFHEIDFKNTAIINGPIIETEIPIDSIGGVFPASESSEFDYYFLGNERELIGYRKSDGTYTLLIDFLRLGVPLNHGRLDRHNFLLWDDGRITIVNINWNASLGREEATMFLLTPSAEANAFIEREIIILGGVDVNITPLIDIVTEFNRQSDTHQIEVANYSYDDMNHLHTKLIAGRGPDIFILSWRGIELVAALGEGFYLVDLYQMIDADPDISREDFFPTVLSTWENSRGELVRIAPSFSIQAIIGMQSVFPEAPKNWNYADFITFYDEARLAGYNYPLGPTHRLQIVQMLVFSDDTFYCVRTATANFDSDAFLDVLNFIMTIPAEQGWEMIPEDIRMSGLWDPVGDLLKGEQLLLPFEDIRDPMDLRTLQTRLGGTTIFSFPANDTPVHFAHDVTGTAVGIRSNSPHIEAAWGFVRLSLLPGPLTTFHDRLSFPLRVDQFEQLIQRELSGYGPSGTFLPHGETLIVPPLTHSDAELLRDMISNIGRGPIVDHPIQSIVFEDVQAFLAGVRSAEDTARIIQSRVQIYLSERAR